MILYHLTPAIRWPWVQADGLLIRCRECRLRCIWLHTIAKRWHAVRCVRHRHGCELDQLVLLKVRVARRYCTPYGRGVWCCWRDVPTSQISYIGGILL
jgi:hypothetical protein